MQSARATWTDERLDDLSARVDRGFEKVDRDIRELRAEVRSLGGQITGLDRAIRSDLGERFDSLELTIRWFGGTLIAGLSMVLLQRVF